MIDLDFAVQGVEIARRSATPLLIFKLRIGATAPVEHAIVQAQIRIEATHRDYAPAERERLSELFGAAADWDRSLRGLLWTTASASVPGFAEECTVDLPVPCSYDFEIAATKFLHGVQEGEVPLLLLFSGPVFFRNAEGDLQIGQIAHHKEAGYRLPVSLWQSVMAQHYPDRIWLRLERDLFEQVYEYKRRNGFPGFDQAMRALLAESVR